MAKFPKDAKLVFDGNMFKVYQWQQKLYDGSFATFEGIKRRHTAQVIAISDNKINYNLEEQPHRSRPFYGLIGGQIEYDEDPLQGAKRELLEETGMVSDDWELWYSFEPSGKIDWTIYWYIAKNCRKIENQHLDPGEKITLLQTDIETFMNEVITSPDFRDAELKNRFLGKFDEDKVAEFKLKLGLK